MLTQPQVLDLTAAGNANVSVGGGLTLNNATVSLGNSSGGYGILRFSDANSVLGGTNGSVVFSNLSNSVYNTLQENLAGGTLTIGPGITIHGGTGSIGYNPNIGGPSNVAVINQGTILADSAGTLTVGGASATNQGTFQAASGGTLIVQPTTLTNFSAGTLTGGIWTAFAGGTLQITNADITTNAASIVLDGAGGRLTRDIAGGSALANFALNSAAGSLTVRNGAAPALSGLTNAGTVTIGAGSTLQLEGPGQYASSVLDFSSQYSTGSWSAAQALGPPNTLSYGDILHGLGPFFIKRHAGVPCGRVCHSGLRRRRHDP